MRSALALAAFAMLLAQPAWAHHHDFEPPSSFALGQPAVGGAQPAHAVPAYATSSRIAVLEGGALVIDADSGWLIRTDLAGAALQHVAIGLDAGTLAYDPIRKRAFVADRRGDRIVVVSVDQQLAIQSSFPTPAEPYGVALAPDRKTLLVTCIADRTLVAYDAITGKEAWRAALDPEPRGISIAADGLHAAVGSLAVGAVDQIDLASHKRARLAVQTFDLPDQPEHARGAFAVQYVGDHLMAAALQLELPAARRAEFVDHYGGGEDPPILHALAFVDDRGKAATAITNVNEPRALAWDGARDLMYVAGMASDSFVQIRHASQVDISAGLTGSLGTRCGADGLAIDQDGSVLVWCSFTRAVVRVTPSATKLDAKVGPELVTSNLDATQHLGLVMFHTASTDVSQAGGLSCGNCHVDGRSDGESWLIHDDRLQTPMLAGRMVGTAPFKWDGGAKDLPTSLRATIERLGGTGLSKKHIAALTAYLEALPAVRTPTRDPAAVARGKTLFDSGELGCTSCHDGAMFTDRERHKFGGKAIDTPSLVGLAASAPYFHDGSAPTLEALLRDHGTVHGMAGTETGALTDARAADLKAYLETL
ncbi:MAG TPA: c-type cytochrome [Kofleriaceae bacterium]|nr:c-type cytochrome [Kofleriaceae bacterium]